MKVIPFPLATLTVLLAGDLVLAGQIFEDRFETYSTGSAVAWDESSGTLVVNESVIEAFGSPNRSAEFSGTSIKLMKNLETAAVGMVTTFATDFVEPLDSTPSSGLVVGFGTNNEINTDNAAVRIELRNGQIRQNTIGGLSSVMQTGNIGYEKGVRSRLYIVVNDTDSPLEDYMGEEDLAAKSFEVWRYSAFGGLQEVLEATLGRDPQYAGFRTWSSFDGLFYVDNVRIDSGVNLATENLLNCGLVPGSPWVLNGSSLTLAYTVESEIPDGATFEIDAAGAAVFTGGNSGPASTSGEIEATVSGENREGVSFTITFRDAEGEFLCGTLANVVVFDYTTPSTMVHPSITNTQAQLDVMTNEANSFPSSVTRAGWDAMRGTPYASLNYVHSAQEIVSVVPSGTNNSERAFRNDSQAARAHALQWVITGDPAHRDKALQILNDWGHAFRDIVSTGSFAQTYLECAWALPVWLSAADILRYHNDGAANWDPADMAAFNYFMELLYLRAIQAFDRGNNWGASAALAAMAYGAWVGDEVVFEEGLRIQLEKLDSLSEIDGEIEEVCRDTWHPQYTVVTWGDSAELAHNQGRDDLYEATFDGQDTPRLVIVLEYFANLMLGNTQPPCGSGWGYNYHSEYDRFDNYEVPYNHYIRRKNVDYLPVFSLMVEDFWRNDVGEDAHFLLWSRLTHGAEVAETAPRGKGVLSVYSADANRWIDTGDWIGWVNDADYSWLYHFGIGYFYISDSATSSGAWIYVPR